MKVALITRGFTGSIFPLAKQMLKDGHSVDVFIICNRKKLDDIEAFECDYIAKNYGLQQIPYQNWVAAKEYMQSDKIRLFTIRYCRPYESVPIVRHIISTVNNYLTKSSVSYINEERYDLINIVAGYYSKEYIPFLKYLKLKPIISLHEVCNHFTPNFLEPSPFLKAIFKQYLSIIVYSDNTLKDLLNYKEANNKNIYRINFGNFSSYESVAMDKVLELPQKYILFFGTLKKYKGLNILYDAITKYNTLPKDVKCVVAGAGNDESFELMKTDSRFVCIQKRLSNSEIVRLISDSIAVICPYLTVSQSGIPQTVFVYKKPIIASRLDGFTEILNYKNSLLFKTGVSSELSENISKLLNNRAMYTSLVQGIEQFSNSSSPYSWEYIANQYYKIVDR